MKKISLILLSAVTIVSLASVANQVKADIVQNSLPLSSVPVNVDPTVDNISSTDSKVTGTGIPGSKIRVYNVDNKVIGLGDTDDWGRYSVSVRTQYLPLEVNGVLRITQDSGYGESEGAIVSVHEGHQDEAKSNFMSGYWSDDQSFLVIEGQLFESSFDFSHPSNTNFTMHLKNSDGVNVYSHSCVTTDFYLPEKYNGFQGLLETGALGNYNIIPSGSYTISIEAVNTEAGISNTTLLAKNVFEKYNIHHDWSEIESKTINGRTVTFTVGPNGVALLTIK